MLKVKQRLPVGEVKADIEKVKKDDTDLGGEDLDIDEDAEDATTYYADSDQDGYGDPDLGFAVRECVEPASGRYVRDSSDCADLGAFVHPGAIQLGHGIDGAGEPARAERRTAVGPVNPRSRLPGARAFTAAGAAAP